MKIYFVRHGESQANRLHMISNRSLPHGLTGRGRRQAKVLADRLDGLPICQIYTSPLLRAVETSAILAEALNLQYETADGLKEFDCGIAEGRSDEKAWQLWQEEFDAWTFGHNYDYRIEGGEGFWDVQRRFGGFIEGLLATYRGSQAEIVCVSHGGIYRVLFPWIMANVTPAMMEKYELGYTSCVAAEYTDKGLTCLEWDGMRI